MVRVEGAGRSTAVSNEQTAVKTAVKQPEKQPLIAENSQSKLNETNFSANLTAFKLSRTPPPGQGTTSSGNGTQTTYRVGDPTRPPIFHDNGFLQNPSNRRDPNPIPTIEPTQDDREYYNDQRSNAGWAQRLLSLGFDENSELPSWLPEGIRNKFEQNKHFLDSPDGIDAYRHFLEGNGADRTFDYERFVRDDAAGQVVLNNATADLQRGVEDIYNQMIANDPSLANKPVTFRVTGGVITVGNGTVADGSSFPYPATDNWQKAIGGHSIWSSGTVTVTPPQTAGGKPQFSMRMTLHAEDRYNFNPNQRDIETNAPDALRGRLEQVGLARQYMNYATLQRDVTWSQGNISTPGGTVSRPPR